MGVAGGLYNTIFKRTSTYTLAMICGAFLFERTFDLGTETLFDRLNQGKLWKHIKHNYEK